MKEYVRFSRKQLDKSRQIIFAAGTVLARQIGIEEDVYFGMREDSLVDKMDPVQALMPTPYQ